MVASHLPEPDQPAVFPVFTIGLKADPPVFFAEKEGDRKTFTLTALRSNGDSLVTAIRSVSTNPTIATANGNTVIHHKPGTAYITFYFLDEKGREFSAVVASHLPEPVKLPPVPIIYPEKVQVVLGEPIHWVISKSYHPQGKTFSSQVEDENGSIVAFTDFSEVPSDTGTVTRFLRLTDSDGMVSLGVAQAVVVPRPVTPDTVIVTETTYIFKTEVVITTRASSLRKTLGNFSLISGVSLNSEVIHAYDPSLAQFLSCWDQKEAAEVARDTNRYPESVHFGGIRFRIVGDKVQVWLYAGYSGGDLGQRDEAFALSLNGQLVMYSDGCPIVPDQDQNPPTSGQRFRWVYIGEIAL